MMDRYYVQLIIKSIFYDNHRFTGDNCSHMAAFSKTFMCIQTFITKDDYIARWSRSYINAVIKQSSGKYVHVIYTPLNPTFIYKNWGLQG